MKRSSHSFLLVAVVWCFSIPASAQNANDMGTRKSPHLESLKWPKQLLDGIIAVRPKSSEPKADHVPLKSEVKPDPQVRTPKEDATAPDAKDSGDQVEHRSFTAQENSLASLDAEIDLIATELLKLQEPAAVIELYDRWYKSYKADNQAAGNSNDNLTKFRTLAAYLNSAFAERMLAQQLLSPQTVEDKDAGKLKSRVDIFMEANVRYAKAVSTIDSGIQAFEKWRTKGLPKPNTDEDVAIGKFPTSPMTADRSAEFYLMLLLWQGRLYRELGDVIYRETGSSYATRKIPLLEGYTRNSTAYAWYQLARDPLYMGIVLDKNNREVQREAELVALRLGWIKNNRIFGGVDFFQFPTHREGYITDHFNNLTNIYGKLNATREKVDGEMKSQDVWLTNLQNVQDMRDSLDRGFAQIQREGLEKSISEVTEKTNATVSRVAWERLQNVQSQLTNANLYVTNKLHIAHLNNDYGQEKARLQLELADVLQELKLQGIYGHTSILDQKGLESVAGSLQLALSVPESSKIDVTNDCLKSFPLIVNLANSMGVTSKAGDSYTKVSVFFSASNQGLGTELRKAWEESIAPNNLSRLSVQYLEVYKAHQNAVTKVVELNTFLWESERSRIQELVYERQKAYSDAMTKLEAAETKISDDLKQEAKDEIVSAATNAVDELYRQIQIDQERIRLDQLMIDRHRELLASVKKLEMFQEVGKAQLLGKAYIASLLKSLPSYTLHTQGVSSGVSTDPVYNEIKKVDATLNYTEFAHNIGVALLQNKSTVTSRGNELSRLEGNLSAFKSQVEARSQQLQTAKSNLNRREQSADQLRMLLVSVNQMRVQADELLKQYDASKNLYQPSNHALKNNERTLLEVARDQAIADVYSKLVELSVAAAKSDQLIEKAAQITARFKSISASEDALNTYREKFDEVIKTFQIQEAEAVSHWTDAQRAEQEYLLGRSDDLVQKLIELSSPKERVVTADYLKQFAPAFVDAELTGEMQAHLDFANQHLANVARWLYLFSGEQNKCLQLATPARSVGELQMAIENVRREWEIFKGTIVDPDRPPVPTFGSKQSAVVVRLVAPSDMKNNTSRLTLETRYDNLENRGFFNADGDSLYVKFFAQNGASQNSQEIAGYEHILSPSGSCLASLPGVFSKYNGQQVFVTGIWLFPRSKDGINRLSAEIEHVGPHFARVNGRRRTMPLKVSVGGGSIRYSPWMSVQNLAYLLQKENWRDSKGGFGVNLDEAKPIGLDGTIFGLGLDGTWQINLFEKDASGREVPYSISQGDQIDVVFTFLFREANNKTAADSAPATMPQFAGSPEVDESAFYGDLLLLRPEGFVEKKQSVEKPTDLIKTELDTVFNNRPNAIEATPPVNLLQVRNQAEEILDALILSVEKEYVAKLGAAKSTIEDRELLQDQLNKLITILGEERKRYGKANEYRNALLKLKNSVKDQGLFPKEREDLTAIVNSLTQEMIVRQTLKEWCADESKRQALIDHILHDLVLKYQGNED